MGNYLLATTAEKDAKRGEPAGAINGGFFPYQDHDCYRSPMVSIAIQSTAETMDKLVANGGEVFGEPMDIPDIGKYVTASDTEGNHFSILQPHMPE